ncbi:Delta(14)-sterol reductase [Malassezia sp. CBS 17886]|nr:Delta(14)-sterol reductase [Malassezia sp. CBS 17886]
MTQGETTNALATPGEDLIAPRSTELEFGGPLGALFVTTAVPITMYYLALGCSEELGCSVSTPVTNMEAFFAYASREFRASFHDRTAWLLYAAWYAYCVAAWMVLPGRWVKGLPLRTGRQLEYKLNALATALLAFGGVAVYISVYGPASFTVLYDHWPGLLSAALVNAIVQAVYVYAASFHGTKLLARGGNSGNMLFDWFIGRELNPRIGAFDIKTFNELRPGLVLWVLMDISCLCAQWTQFGLVSDSMVLVVLFHAWYVIDSTLNEATIFTQMDITTDGFGFMLSVGDLAWVPFTYSLQARYLAFHPVHLHWTGVAAILLVQAVGFYIFRTANVEKNDFRRGYNPKGLQSMTTSSGRQLLVSGWWGRSRHPNYLGDWIMAWAWCLPCGFATPIPYFYVVYFAVLLVHRQLRDDDACREKYGNEYVTSRRAFHLTTSSWADYTARVPSRIIPYVY